MGSDARQKGAQTVHTVDKIARICAVFGKTNVFCPTILTRIFYTDVNPGSGTTSRFASDPPFRIWTFFEQVKEVITGHSTCSVALL